jgi:hypothetical protein
VALAVACGKGTQNPASPSAGPAANTSANADGSNLKASAPTPVSPANGTRFGAGQQVTLVVSNSSLSFASGVALSYEFQLYGPTGALVATATLPGGPTGTTSWLITAQMEGERTYSWQARAVFDGAVGPWSPRWSYVSPLSEGYIRGNELYDPLINGKTVGIPVGPVTFIPGLGAKLEAQTAHIKYELPQTLYEGEFSILVTNLHTNTEGGKTKLFAMGKGYDDIVTNEYRMTVEKRGDPPGTVAWRFIARDDQIDTEGAEREIVQFDPSETYLWQATWRSNYFNVLIRRGGVNGQIIYDKGKHWEGRGYEPSPHVLYLGAPVGRSGVDGASVDGVIIRQMWVSGGPRPPQANQ